MIQNYPLAVWKVIAQFPQDQTAPKETGLKTLEEKRSQEPDNISKKQQSPVKPVSNPTTKEATAAAAAAPAPNRSSEFNEIKGLLNQLKANQIDLIDQLFADTSVLVKVNIQPVAFQDKQNAETAERYRQTAKLVIRSVFESATKEIRGKGEIAWPHFESRIDRISFGPEINKDSDTVSASGLAAAQALTSWGNNFVEIIRTQSDLVLASAGVLNPSEALILKLNLLQTYSEMALYVENIGTISLAGN